MFNLKGRNIFLFQPNSMLYGCLLANYCKELTALQPCKNSLYKILRLPDGVLMESTYLSLSQSGFYQEFIRSIRTLSGCMWECNLQPCVRKSRFALKHAK